VPRAEFWAEQRRPQWRLIRRSSALLPPLAWVARVRHPNVVVACGESVRWSEDAFFDGTWVGPESLSSIATSTTPFGAGIAVVDGSLMVLPPAHSLEGVYVFRAGNDSVFVANTLCGLLEAANLQLLPDTDYVSRFIRLGDGLRESPLEIPTSRGDIRMYFFENLFVRADGEIVVSPKPREAPFTSYNDYFARIDAALASLLANAPGYSPAVTLSNGYDSTAMAVLAARHGCGRALTFAEARPAQFDPSDVSDSGEATARRLGMGVELFDRLAYQRRDDLAEAEFLATGMSGEDVANVAMEGALRRAALITGDVGAALWRYGRKPTSDLWRIDISATSFTEFRLRTNFMFIPLPVFGITETASLQAITVSDEMRPWSIRGYYNRPIPRRIAEDAGLQRGSFAVVKHAATALLHQGGEVAFAPATAASTRAFAAAEGKQLDWRPRPRLRRRDRALLKAARAIRAGRLVRPLARRQRGLIHHDPVVGSVLFRWAVAQVGPRYQALGELLAE